jgi:hypothetical protein
MESSGLRRRTLAADQTVETASPSPKTSLASHGKLEGRRILQLFIATSVGYLATELLDMAAKSVCGGSNFYTILDHASGSMIVGSATAALHALTSVTSSIGTIVKNATCCKKQNMFDLTFASSASVKLTAIAFFGFISLVAYSNYKFLSGNDYRNYSHCGALYQVGTPIAFLALSTALYNVLQRVWPTSAENGPLKPATLQV